MNSFNNEVCEYDYSNSVTENFMGDFMSTMNRQNERIEENARNERREENERWAREQNNNNDCNNVNQDFFGNCVRNCNSVDCKKACEEKAQLQKKDCVANKQLNKYLL